MYKFSYFTCRQTDRQTTLRATCSKGGAFTHWVRAMRPNNTGNVYGASSVRCHRESLLVLFDKCKLAAYTQITPSQTTGIASPSIKHAIIRTHHRHLLLLLSFSRHIKVLFGDKCFNAINFNHYKH